jgi:hypothetical protein
VGVFQVELSGSLVANDAIWSHESQQWPAGLVSALANRYIAAPMTLIATIPSRRRRSTAPARA